MEYISAEEFRKQPVEVQNLFIDWWKPSIGGLFNYKEDDEHDCIEVECIQSKNRLRTIALTGVIPLLTEGQLRKFIEDKTEFPILKIELINGQYDIYTQYKAIDNHSDIYVYDELGEDLLQAYWKVAIQIAEEIIKIL